MKKISCFLFAILTVACDNIHTVDAPWDSEPIPVVYSIISPDASVQVFLNQTYNSDFKYVKNPYPEARIFICGPDSIWTELNRLKADTCVFVDAGNSFSIDKGKTYSLKVVLENKIVHAQTTIPPVAATIESVVCNYKPVEKYSSVMLIQHELVEVNGFPIKVTCKLLPDNNYGYDLSAFRNANIEIKYLIDKVYEYNDFPCPKDTSSFMLRLYTLDSNYKKHQIAASIVEMEDFNSNLIVAIIQKFGGVLPQFSNIENGVGLFSSYVTDSARVDITNYPLQN